MVKFLIRIWPFWFTVDIFNVIKRPMFHIFLKARFVKKGGRPRLSIKSGVTILNMALPIFPLILHSYFWFTVNIFNNIKRPMFHIFLNARFIKLAAHQTLSIKNGVTILNMALTYFPLDTPLEFLVYHQHLQRH